jgi:hypothetical protein
MRPSKPLDRFFQPINLTHTSFCAAWRPSAPCSHLLIDSNAPASASRCSANPIATTKPPHSRPNPYAKIGVEFFLDTRV